MRWYQIFKLVFQADGYNDHRFLLPSFCIEFKRSKEVMLGGWKEEMDQ